MKHICVIGYLGAARTSCVPALLLLDRRPFIASEIAPPYQRAAAKDLVCLALQSGTLRGSLSSLLQQKLYLSLSPVTQLVYHSATQQH